MYSGGRIRAFDDFRLRRVVELDAMKLFLLFVQRRDRKSNLAIISYDKIEDYTGITRPRIKSALSFLSAFPLVYVEPQPSVQSEFGVSNAYRIVGIEPRVPSGDNRSGDVAGVAVVASVQWAQHSVGENVVDVPCED
jgi:hypothetical protein